MASAERIFSRITSVNAHASGVTFRVGKEGRVSGGSDDVSATWVVIDSDELRTLLLDLAKNDPGVLHAALDDALLAKVRAIVREEI